MKKYFLNIIFSFALMSCHSPLKVQAQDYYALSSLQKPTSQPTQIYGGYANGCLDGAVSLPAKGAGFQTMRPSRNRYWGHPTLINYITRLAKKIESSHPWHGILIGDMSQPVGGPMPSGHTSHQSGLDVDIWLDPALDTEFSYLERNNRSATSYVTPNMTIRPSWTQAHTDFVLMAAEDSDVERIFINAALKKHLCVTGYKDDMRLQKIRPWFGHDDHIHVRLKCPAHSPSCVPQDSVPYGTGCTGNDLEWWFSEEARHPKPTPPATKKFTDLPMECQNIINKN